MNIFRVFWLYLGEGLTSPCRVINDRLLTVLIVGYCNYYFLFHIKFLHNIHTITLDSLRACVIIDVCFSNHLACYSSHFFYIVNSVYASSETILFEIATCPTEALHLGLDNKLPVVVGAKFSCNSECLLFIECDLTERYWHVILVDQLSRLIFV